MQYARFREGMRLPYRPASYIFLDRDGLIQSIEHVITKHDRFQHIYRQRATNTAVESFQSSFSTLCEQLKCHVGSILIATGPRNELACKPTGDHQEFVQLCEDKKTKQDWNTLAAHFNTIYADSKDSVIYNPSDIAFLQDATPIHPQDPLLKGNIGIIISNSHIWTTPIDDRAYCGYWTNPEVFQNEKASTGKKQQAEDANLVFIPATSWNKAFSFEHVGQGQQKLHMPEMYAAGFWSNALKLFRINHGLDREKLFPFVPPATPSAWDPFDL